jgi:hypothetical protein
MKKTAYLLASLLLMLCACKEREADNTPAGRIRFKENAHATDTDYNIISVDSVDFLVHTRSGYMIQITNK